MIRSLHLRSFKSFSDTEVPLGPFTLLVGTNASGKSNVRDALQFLHGCAQGYSVAEVLDGKWGPGGIQQWHGLRGGLREIAHRDSHFLSLKIALDLPFKHAWEADDGWYTMGVDLRHQPTVDYEALNVDWQTLFDSNPEEDPILQKDDHLLRVRFPRGGRYRKHGQVRGYLPSTCVLSQVINDEKVKQDHRRQARRVLDLLREMRFLDLAPHAMRKASLPGQTILGDRGENLSSVLMSICESPERKSALLGWLRALTPLDARDLSFKEDFQGRVLVHLVEADGHETSAYSTSDGTLRFLALAAALLSPDSGHFYFFEEIDNGFHPTRLHLLLDVLEQATRQMGCQIVATTHNPQLLAFLSEKARQDAVLIYRREHSKASDAKRIVELPEIPRILETQDLGRLFASGWLEDAVEFTDEAPTRAEPVAIASS